jgi:hypothetical protein
MLFGLIIVFDDQMAAHHERPSCADLERILKSAAVGFPDGRISQLEAGPPVWILIFADRLEDREFLSPTNLALVYRLHARRRRVPPSAGHDGSCEAGSIGAEPNDL